MAVRYIAHCALLVTTFGTKDEAAACAAGPGHGGQGVFDANSFLQLITESETALNASGAEEVAPVEEIAKAELDLLKERGEQETEILKKIIEMKENEAHEAGHEAKASGSAMEMEGGREEEEEEARGAFERSTRAVKHVPRGRVLGDVNRSGPWVPATAWTSSIVVLHHVHCGISAGDQSLICWPTPLSQYPHQGNQEDWFTMTNGLVLASLAGGSTGDPYNVRLCWVTSDGLPGCLGFQSRTPSSQDVPLNTTARKVAVDWAGACAIDLEGNLQIWGYSKSFHESGIAPSGTAAVDVDCGADYCCAILVEPPAIKCSSYGSNTLPTGNFSKIWCRHDRYDDLAPLCCALPAESGGVVCMAGEGTHTQPDPPAGVRFDALSISQAFICGIRSSDSAVECWGANWQSTKYDDNKWDLDPAILADTPTGPAADLSCWRNKCCAIMVADGSALCWGSSAQSPPAGAVFQQIEQIGGATTATATSTATTASITATHADQSSVVGDPHVVNVAHAKFEIRAGGLHKLVQIPQHIQANSTPDLRVDATIQHLVSNDCSKSFMTSLSIVGRWADDAFGLIRISQGSDMPNTTLLINKKSPEEFSTQFPFPGVKAGHTFVAFKLRDVSFHVGKHFEGRYGKQQAYLNVRISGLKKHNDLGGLLGYDDHTDAEKLDVHCLAAEPAAAYQSSFIRNARSAPLITDGGSRIEAE